MTKSPTERNRFSLRLLRAAWPGFLRHFINARKLRWPELGLLEAGFLAVVALALGMRLWELGGRAMHYDEAIHLPYAWRLLNSDGAGGGFPWIFGKDFIHSPWMHGPFQIEFTAIIFRIFGDTDFTARLGYALFGAALAGLPYFLRDYIGRTGAVVAGLMLTVSPAMLYFSRFGRNDILMAFWATALLVLILERTPMIGILKALGARDWSIRKVFLYNAAYLIGIGLLWGNGLGLALLAVQHRFRIFEFPNPEEYYIDYIPVYMDLPTILLLNLGVLLLCLLMLLLPSYIITRISPVRAIQFD